MISLSLSTMKISSSSSTKPTSPVCSHPSASMLFLVASGLFRSPPAGCGRGTCRCRGR
ncbi:hypothetical protein U9M48_040245 [Paspalum notatum var. saurae]|uniref:Uncharacterized protein n=1 Tax=Paspalum notatum var. saurae TaxID=547442 RepID=A0AAQ3XDI9_PASNO